MEQINRKWEEEKQYFRFIDEYTNYTCTIKKSSMSNGEIDGYTNYTCTIKKTALSDEEYVFACIEPPESSILHTIDHLKFDNKILRCIEHKNGEGPKRNSFCFSTPINESYQGINSIKNECIILAKELFEFELSQKSLIDNKE